MESIMINRLKLTYNTMGVLADAFIKYYHDHEGVLTPTWKHFGKYVNKDNLPEPIKQENDIFLGRLAGELRVLSGRRPAEYEGNKEWIDRFIKEEVLPDNAAPFNIVEMSLHNGAKKILFGRATTALMLAARADNNGEHVNSIISYLNKNHSNWLAQSKWIWKQDDVIPLEYHEIMRRLEKHIHRNIKKVTGHILNNIEDVHESQRKRLSELFVEYFDDVDKPSIIYDRNKGNMINYLADNKQQNAIPIGK